MLTEKLYDLNSYVSEFDCKVISLYSQNGKIFVITDRTAFFPEGGGQTSDVGFLDDAYVEKVEIANGEIRHIVENSEENMKKFAVGAVLRGKIDKKKRFSDMQQHSGEHIFSGVVHKLFGYDNVGFHLGKESVAVDFNGVLDQDDVRKVERLANKAVWDDIEIRTFYPNETELETLEYRSKKEIDGELRIVEIPGVDVCACCAPHVGRTGEIGLIEVVGFEKYKGGSRLSILCGERALNDVRKKLDENHEVGKILSAKETETSAMVGKLKKDCSQLGYELQRTKFELLKRRAREFEAEKRIVEFCDIRDANILREFADLLSERADDFAAVFGGGESEYKYVIIAKSSFDVRSLCVKLNAEFNGRGGGRNGIVQGSIEGDRRQIEEWLRKSID